MSILLYIFIDRFIQLHLTKTVDNDYNTRKLATFTYLVIQTLLLHPLYLHHVIVTTSMNVNNIQKSVCGVDCYAATSIIVLHVDECSSLKFYVDIPPRLNVEVVSERIRNFRLWIFFNGLSMERNPNGSLFQGALEASYKELTNCALDKRGS